MCVCIYTMCESENEQTLIKWFIAFAAILMIDLRNSCSPSTLISCCGAKSGFESVWLEIWNLRFVDFKKQKTPELVWETRKGRRGEHHGETLNSQEVFEGEAEKGSQRDRVQVKMSVWVWVRDLMQLDLVLKVLQQDFHVSEGLDSKVKLKRGSTGRKKSFGEWDYVHFIHSIPEQETKG